MIVLQVCAFAAHSPGNFITSLTGLEKELNKRNITTIYAFPERAKNMKWCVDLQRNTKVYFLPEAKARILPKTYQIFKKIYKENDIGIVHSHFELYDIPATITAKKNTKIFWHLHDPISIGDGLRSILWRFQYSIVGKRANLLSVSEYYRNYVVNLGFPENQTYKILNGINLDRINNCSQKSDCIYDFLTFGWDFHRKGDDIILDACELLEQNGYKFKLLLNGNEKTWQELDKYLNGKKPSYLIKGESVDDINQLFKNSRVFVQASRKETFSYAVCEAAYAGLPVICSEIPGLEWANSVPCVTFFQNENVNQLYAIMKDFLDGKNLNASTINNSRIYIADNLSLEVWIKNVIGFYGV